MIELQMISPLLLALLPGLWSFGHVKRMFWTLMIFLLLPVLLAVPGSMILGELGMAWRCGVWRWCGLGFLAGIVELFIWAAMYLWKDIPEAQWRRLAVWLCRAVILAAAGGLCIVFTLFGSLFVLFFADQDYIQELDGQAVVAQYLWNDGCNYYTCHGPLVRGAEPLEGSTDLTRQKEQEARDTLRVEAMRRLGLEGDCGVVEAASDTHGGFHGDGEAFVQLYFADGDVLEQIEASGEWTALPLPEELAILARRVHSGGPISGVERGYYWFQDRQAADNTDYSETLERYSYNFTLALYDADSRRLYYWKLDT